MERTEPTMDEVLAAIRTLFIQVANGYRVDKNMLDKAKHAYKLLGYAIEQGEAYIKKEGGQL